MVYKTITILIVILLLAGAAGFFAQEVEKESGLKDRGKKIMDVLDDMFENQRRGNMNVPPEDGRLLRILAETTKVASSPAMREK